MMRNAKYSFLATVLLLLSSTLYAQFEFEFQNNSQLRKTIKNEIWQTLKKITPKDYALTVTASFLGNLPFSYYDQLAYRFGLMPNDVSVAETYFKTVCWELVHGQELTKNHIIALKNQIQNERKGKFTDRTDAEKQQLSDPLILKAVWLSILNDLATRNGDKTTEAKVKQLASDWFYELTATRPILLAPSTLGLLPVSRITSQENSKKGKKESTAAKKPDDPASSVAVSGNDPGIEDVVMRTETRMGLGGSTYVENVVYLFLKDSSCRVDPVANPYQWDIEKDKSEQPKKWSKWVKSGSTITRTRYNGKSSVWKKWFNVQPGGKGQKIEGIFQSADAFGGSKVHNFSTIALNKTGQFSWKTTKGGHLTEWFPVYSNTRTAGTYEISRYSITLSYNNGQSESFFFAHYPKSDRHFIIGANHFAPVKK